MRMHTSSPIASCTELPLANAFLATGHLTLHEVDDPRRPEVEHCIRQTYARRYGALVPSFTPVLLALREGASVLAAAGYRRAADGPLFLEHYLPAPAHELIAQHAGAPVLRSGIVEVGHLAAPRSGDGPRLIQLLGPLLLTEGFEWVVSTVTRELQTLLVRQGVMHHLLAPALPEALGDQALCWGSYYDHAPVVVAIHLRRSLRQFLARRARAFSREAA
jgi:hypothetical protein